MSHYLELGAAKAFNGMSLVVVLDTDRHDGLSNVHASDLALWLTKGTTHTGLEPISSGARQHLVDTEDVVGVDADTNVKSFLSNVLGKVLVGANAGSFKGLRGQLATT